MMGTGTFALPTFRGLYELPHDLVGLFTQPDRTGRGHHHHRNPLKELAQEKGTAVFQPEQVNQPESLQQLRKLQPDLCVVAAYGQLLSGELLRIPSHGAINVHASLLPKYRGAAPIQWALREGEAETGITIFQIEPKLDAGPMLGMVKTDIGANETAGELESRLAELAIPLTQQVIEQIATGRTEPVTQDSSLVTRAPRLKKSDGDIDWSQSARQIEHMLRAFQPWPTAYSFLLHDDQSPQRLIIIESKRFDRLELPKESTANVAEPGTVIFADSKSVIVQTGDGFLQLLRLRPEGKRAMTCQEFLCGHAIQPGDRFVNKALLP